MAEKAQKVCIHTNVITQVNSLIKIVERVYLLKKSKSLLNKSYSRPMDFKGWSCVSIVKDKHNTADEKSKVQTEYEIWVNDKNLDKTSTILKGLQKKSFESNLEQDPNGRYQVVRNYTTVKTSVEFDQNDPKIAEFIFNATCCSYAHECEYSDFYLIRCPDFEKDIKYNDDGSLKYAYARDHEGNIIFGIYDTWNN